MSDWRIALSELDYGAEEEAAVLRVVRSRWLSMGAEVRAFESEFAQFLGVKHAFATANATSALHLAFIATGLQRGDEVIQPTINFVAAANMTVAADLKPIFADIISVDEPTIAPEEIERRITPKTKAIVVMHYGGYACRMDDIVEICRKHSLVLIEDACHAPGVCYSPGNRMLGAIGDVGTFSFFGNKNLVTGEGGMLVTNRDDIASRVKLLRSHGMTTLSWDRFKGHAAEYDAVVHGFNYRFNELGAALGRCQLAKLPHNNQQRADLVTAYRERLSGKQHWTVPFSKVPVEKSACHLMVAVAPSEKTRLQAASKLGAAGIQTSRHYPCVTSLSSFRRYHDEGLARSAEFASRVLTLPLHPKLSHDDLAQVSDALYSC